ncbi:MAG: glycosyltransferase family 1 protein, partial [Thiotrichales bacterium]|nr:glycosyltransferase family 1 protein [Thiotrichales bacterium]
MKIIIATDAWQPQVNGVVRTYENMQRELVGLGHKVTIIHSGDFRTIPCPTYPSIRLAVFPYSGVCRQIESVKPDAIHIATEGPIGQACRKYCLKHELPFTTSYHTRFPEYIKARAPVPLWFSYALVRNFHKPAVRTFVPTGYMRDLLLERGFSDVVIWSRGVDTRIFKPGAKEFLSYERPVMVYMGRVAVEKNIEAFLNLDLPGTRLVIGDGPDLEKLKSRFPGVKFPGYKFGEELAAWLAASDVFVFPSRTDTFGIVLLEAMACGLPVAAYPVTGPVDVVKRNETGVLNEDLKLAVESALKLDPQDCIDYARAFSWKSSAECFLSNLASINPSGTEPEVTAHYAQN